jgi:hypothetical protein
MKSLAQFSSDPKRIYRYALWRIWDETLPLVMFIGLNPSTADEVQDDPTISACIRQAQSWKKYGGIVMANLFAYRDTKQASIWLHPDPVGPENDKWLAKLATDTRDVVAAWGNEGTWRNRSANVARMIPNLHCLKINKSGEPHHPLYLPSNIKMIPYARPNN